MAKNKELKKMEPNWQIGFYYRLKLVKKLYLDQALIVAVKNVDIDIINRELSEFVEKNNLKKITISGLRGELFYPIPCLLKENPHLLGYYRLLYGFSQKEFYSQGGYGMYKSMEEKGICKQSESSLKSLCKSLARTSGMLIDGIDSISKDVIYDLQLLTLGPQLRGSNNTEIGKNATKITFELIRDITNNYIKESNNNSFIIVNDSQRKVAIVFSSDPDISIIEQFEKGKRPLVSIEIKGGTDISNIHNRLGEAEKSHQKAKDEGFHEFWTIVKCDIDIVKVKKESPTTSHFFNLDKIINAKSEDGILFRNLLSSVLGIRI